jgi:hypothetical protein
MSTELEIDHVPAATIEEANRDLQVVCDFARRALDSARVLNCASAAPNARALHLESLDHTIDQLEAIVGYLHQVDPPAEEEELAAIPADRTGHWCGTCTRPLVVTETGHACPQCGSTVEVQIAEIEVNPS